MEYVVKIAIFLWLSVFEITRGTQILSGTTPSFKDITSSVFQGSTDGVVAAYGDFNNDKKPDIFVIVEQGHKINLWIWVETSKTVPGSTLSVLQKSEKVIISTKNNDTVITSVVPGDYNGDSMMDLLVTMKPTNKAKDLTVATSAYIYWGDPSFSIESEPTVVSENLYDQPHVMDFNADMIPDLFGATLDGNRFFWTGNSTDKKAISPTAFDTVTNKTEGATLLPLRKPHSHNFIDINGDYGADLLVTATDDSGLTKFERWYNVGGNLKWDGSYLPDLPIENPAYVGQSAYVDIDMDGKMDHIVPVCEDSKCVSSSIYVNPSGRDEWILVANSFEGAGSNWGFVPPDDNPLPISTVPVMLWVGDYTLDGYVDAMAIMRNGTDNKASIKIILLENILCSSTDPAVCQQGYRTFRVDIEEGIMNIDNPVLASFCDFYDDGALDIVVTTMTNPNTRPVIHALQNNLHEDASFVKVNVLSGLCFGDCPYGVEPYGVNQPGPMIKYQTTDPDGHQQISAGGQLSQSAYFSLQQPFVLLGLGQTPNFVDYLTVGIPFTKTPKTHTWTQIIPNSQLIAIPYPPDDPSKWKSKLLVRPSPLIYMTAGVLAATMVFIGAVVGILHWREKREDKEEKRQESHRFHFDAM